MAAVGAATALGSVLFAKNSDREYYEAQYLELVPARRHDAGSRLRLTYVQIDQAPTTHAVLLSKPHWIWGAEIGANEHGLVIGNEAIFSKIEPSLTPGIIGMDFLRLALERAADVDEAISVITSLLREHGQGGNCGFKREMAYHNSFILADPREAKVLETVEREWVVTSVKDYYAISNAMTIDSAIEASSPTLRFRATEAALHASDAPFGFRSVYEDEIQSRSGRHRRTCAMRLLEARNGQLRATDMFGVLRDHTEGQPSAPGRPPPRICAHSRENPLGQTTASWVASLVPGRIVHWVTGTSAACTGLFKPMLMETGLPEHGPRPGGEPDYTSLWWRHEKLRQFLDESGEATRNAYTAERDVLEGRFVEQMASCPSVEQPSGIEEAKRLVAACWREALEFEDRWLRRSEANGAAAGRSP